jgi:hypothetical protein
MTDARLPKAARTGNAARNINPHIINMENDLIARSELPNM